MIADARQQGLFAGIDLDVGMGRDADKPPGKSASSRVPRVPRSSRVPASSSSRVSPSPSRSSSPPKSRSRHRGKRIGRLNFAHAADLLPVPCTPEQLAVVSHLYEAELYAELERSTAAATNQRERRQRGRDRRFAIKSNMPTPNRIIWRRVVVRVLGFYSKPKGKSQRKRAGTDSNITAVTPAIAPAPAPATVPSPLHWNPPWDDRTFRLRAQGVEDHETELDFGMKTVSVFPSQDDREEE